MAAKLECEICGGKLIGKPGGIFECESCGMEYSTEWARQKIQEIRGTVQVEGTVQVTGKVQVEGGTVNVEGTATKESLLKRAKMCCAEKDWSKATELLEQVLNADPECAEAYLYRYLAGQKQPTLEALVADCRLHFAEFPTDSYLKRAEQFADEKLIGLLNRCKQECAETVEAGKKQRQANVGALAEKRKALEPVRKFIACGDSHTVGLRADGTVVAAGDNTYYDHCAVSGWRDVAAIVGGNRYTVGLRADGMVIVAGWRVRDQHMVRNWRDVVAIACGSDHTVGLRADGTVVAVGSNGYGQCKVGDWQDVVAIACATYHTVGLRRDGTVAAVGMNDYGQCNVGDWRDVVAIACRGSHTVGLRADGTVVAAGKIDPYYYGQCEVGNWRDVVAIACSASHTVGLRADGTVVATGKNDQGQCNVGDWKLFNSIEALDQELAEAQERRKREAEEARRQEEQRKQAHLAELAAEKDALQAEYGILLSTFKGLFAGGKRRREIEARLAAIEAEQKSLHSDECGDPAGLL